MNSTPREDRQHALNEIMWEDADLAYLLAINRDFKRLVREFFDQYDEVSASSIKGLIADRLAANNIDELDVGDIVRCGEFVFRIREFARLEETVMKPYAKKGITGVDVAASAEDE